MALESLSDTPPPLVSKGNNDSDIAANNSLIKMETEKNEEGDNQEIPAAELEDGEITDETEEENDDTDEEDLSQEELKRLRKRQKNKERRRRKKEQKKMQELQEWAMALAAGQMQGQEETIVEEEYIPSEDEGERKDFIPPKMLERNFSPKKKPQRKRQRAPSPSESEEEEYTKLLKKEMSRHKLKRKSDEESSSEDRRVRSPGMYDSGGDTPQLVEDESEGEEYVQQVQRSRKKKRKKHKHHHRSKHSSKKPRREQMPSEEEDGRMLPPSHQQQEQYMEQPMSEQDQQIMMDQEMGKIHVPKTHLICKFFLENKCKKGLDCSYTHEGTIPKRLEQCKFYLQGFCSKGPLCMFLHQEYPCKYYHTGQVCYSEHKCRFSHAPLTEELKPLIDLMRKDTLGSKGRDSDQPPLLPSPDKQPIVHFQRGNSGGKPPKPQGKQNNAIPSLFDIKVKPVGEKGQRILEKERKGREEEGSSFYGTDKQVDKENNHSRPSNTSEEQQERARPRSPKYGSQQNHGENTSISQNSQSSEGSNQRPPLLPTPSSSKLQDPRLPDLSAPFEDPYATNGPVENEKDEGQKEAKPTAGESGASNQSKEGGEESPTRPLEEGETEQGDVVSKPAVEPPKSMPAKSKALFMRIQQNQMKASGSEETDESTVKDKSQTDGDDNWYSSDEEDNSKKRQQPPRLTLKTGKSSNVVVAPSAISPEASNHGPLLSSVLIASNKQNEAQTQLPGPLASLFSSAAPASKAAPLPLNILDLVTKGTSSVQKSKNPEVQDLIAGILPQKNNQEGYRLLECIRDPKLKDPREGRERKSKVGMLFRVLKWRNSEYSISDDRPSLPAIELTTPTEMKSPPVFPTTTDARTQAMVDVIKKVINEVRGKPADPRNQRPPVDPRMGLQDPRAFSGDSRAQQGNFSPTHPAHMDPQNPVRPPYHMPDQPPPRQQGPPPHRPHGPGFARHPIGQPNHSFPPGMSRPPRLLGPMRFSNPRFANRGARGQRLMRPELLHRMPHRPNRPLLQPPFGSPPRAPPQRMLGPRGPMLRSPRMEMPDGPAGDTHTEMRDPRGRGAGIDPRLAKRGPPPSSPGASDVDMRVSKDPRLARAQDPGLASQGSGDIDMRRMNPATRHSTYNESPQEQTRGRIDPRQAARVANTSNDVDLRPMAEHGGGSSDSGMPLKDMFKGRDPTASPFV